MSDEFRQARSALVHTVLIPNRIYQPRLLDAIQHLPRHAFVTPRHLAYENRALALPFGQRILAPLTQATIVQAARLSGTERVLEVGTGSGYLTALLLQMAGYVFSLERDARLAAQAADRLHRLGYQNVDLHVGDGSQGLADMSPYDAIIVTAATPKVPGPLAMQLGDGGRLLIPIGSAKTQQLHLIRRQDDRWHRSVLGTIRTTPLVGRYGFTSSSRR